MTNTTAPAAAELIAPLEQLTGQCCQLELVVFSLYRRDDHSQTQRLPVWVKPNSLAAGLKAKQGLVDAGWVIDESWAESGMEQIGARFLAVDGPVYEF